MKKDKPIILLYPPPSDPTQPYSSLPALTSYLRSRQFTVIQRDLGIELLDELLSPKRLTDARDSATIRSIETELSENDGYLARFYNLIGISEYIIEHIEEAKGVMRDKNQFYNLELYQWASRLLKSACDLASLPYHPTVLRPSDYETYYDPTFKGLLEATTRRKDNVFFDLLNQMVLPEIMEKDPLLVGISVTYRSQLIPAFTLARLLKSAAPQIHVSIGGAIIQRFEEPLRYDPACFEFAHSFCIGEGETALFTLAKKISSGKELKNIPNMIIDIDGLANFCNSRFYEDVNALPCPDFDGLELERYLSPEPIFLLSSTRGCYYGKCAFCNVSMNTQMVYRQIKKRQFISNIKELYKKYGTKRFFFCDDAMPPKHMLSISELVKDELHDITWGAEARFERILTQDFVSTLKEGGCRFLIFGLESASQRILNAMNKGNTIEIDKAVLKACSSNGIYVNLQTFIGFPTETPEEAWSTINYLIDNERSISCFGFGCFELEKDTPVYNMPKKYGVGSISIPNERTLRDYFDYVPLIGMTMAEAENELDLARKKLSPIFACRTTFLAGASGSHNLLQFSYYGNEEIYQIWKEIDKPKWVDIPEIDDLVLMVSPTVIFSNPPKKMDSIGHLAFCSKTGRQFLLSTPENRLLELCDGKRTIKEITSLWIEEQTREFDTQILLLARGLAVIREFLRKGLILES